MTASQPESARRSIGQASFSVSARVALQLGRESISSSVIAILELVKNAYDADAENVWIRFLGLGTETPTLVIEDDGCGMTQSELVDNWMVIGTDNKLAARKSRAKKRVLIGEKGLGRLGLDRLAARCVVQSFPQHGDTAIELEIDWSKYEKTSHRLETVAHDLYRIPKTAEEPTTGKQLAKPRGVRLLLRGLKDKWSREDIRRLHRELTLLVSPFSGINDFGISLDSGLNWPEVDGKVSSDDILEAAQWKVVSVIDALGNVTRNMSSPFTDVSYSFHEAWSNTFRDTGMELPRCGPLEFRFYFFRRESIPALSLKKAQIDSFLNANQGIRIYRDGFRVMPYGEPSGEGDWLNLSLRRTRRPEGIRQRGWRVGYNQVVGAVFLTREANRELVDQTNREGIVEGEALFHLRRFALSAIEFFELNRRCYELEYGGVEKPDSDETDRAQRSARAVSRALMADVADLRETVDVAIDRLQEDASAGRTPSTDEYRCLLEGAVSRTAASAAKSQDALETLAKAAEKQQKGLEREKNTLANLASLGILAASFGHESLAAANLVAANVGLLRDEIGSLLFVQPDMKARLDATMETLDGGARRLETFSRFILNNIRRDKRQRRRLRVTEIADKVFSSFRAALEDERGITVSLEYAPDLPAILAFPIDWESIFINFITNSVWALEDTQRDGRQIRVRIHTAKDVLHICFADSGRGLEAGTEARVFEPMFSTKRNRQGDVIGTGLGLSIVQSFVHSHEGSISVQSPCDLGGAEFHIQVPLSV